MLRARSFAPLAAISFVVVVLAIYNASHWRMMRLLEKSKEEDLARRVSSVTRVTARELVYPAEPEILSDLLPATADEQAALLEDYPDSPEYESLAQRLLQMKNASGLAQMILLSPKGQVVADSNFRFLTGEDLPFSIDQLTLEKALQGQPATTPLYEWEGKHFQRDYQPVINAAGTTVGVVMGSISADYLESLQAVRSQVRRLWLLSSVILLLMGVWLYRLFRYMARLERHALQRVRTEAMGALAAGMAHELRNPLAIIRVLAEEVQTDPSSSQSRANAADIIAETERLSQLVTHFLSLSRAPEAVEETRIDLADEVRRVCQLIKKGAPEDLKVVEETPEGECWVHGDPHAVRQLLLNLLLNAREAVENRPGRIDVSLKERRREVELRVTDNGPGIPPKALSRVFEPFYTSRPNGTGLGLAISRSIVTNMGGELTLETSKHGTTAVVRLPAVS